MQNFLGLLQQNAFIIIIAVTGFFGCIVFNLAGKGLSKLYDETCIMTGSNNAFIKQLKLRRENGMRINVNIRNTYAFVMKNMDKYRYLNLSIRDYVKMAYLLQLVCVMLGLMGGVIHQNVWYAAYGCVCAIAVACVGRIEDIDRKEQQVIINIVDYFDNILTSDKKVVESRAKEDYNKNSMQVQRQTEQSGAVLFAEVKESAAKQTVSTKDEPGQLKINEEQRRLIEEVLKEYLA